MDLEKSVKPPTLGRKIWVKVHLWLGLTSGLILVLVGLTGSALVFYRTFDEWLNPALLLSEAKPENDASYVPLSKVVAAANAHHGQPDLLYGGMAPFHDRGVFLLYYAKPVPKETATWKDWTQVLVDPYTGRVRGDRDEWYFMRIIYKFHYTLLLDNPGETIIGVVGIILLVSTATGIYLWWPRSGNWLKAFSLILRRKETRWNLDLHKTTGIYTALVLAVVAFSGVYMIFPKQITPAVSALSPVREWPDVKSERKIAGEPIGFDRAFSVAKAEFPDASLYYFTSPEGEEGTYQFYLRQPGEVLKSGGTVVWVDQYSGEVLEIRNPKKFSAGETFLHWQFPLHNGEALGLPGRIVIFISGFAPLVLFVTGLTWYWRKHRARRAAKTSRAIARVCGAPERSVFPEPVITEKNLSHGGHRHRVHSLVQSDAADSI